MHTRPQHDARGRSERRSRCSSTSAAPSTASRAAAASLAAGRCSVDKASTSAGPASLPTRSGRAQSGQGWACEGSERQAAAPQPDRARGSAPGSAATHSGSNERLAKKKRFSCEARKKSGARRSVERKADQEFSAKVGAVAMILEAGRRGVSGRAARGEPPSTGVTCHRVITITNAEEVGRICSSPNTV